VHANKGGFFMTSGLLQMTTRADGFFFNNHALNDNAGKKKPCFALSVHDGP
jgi:hypothetical protein